MPPTTEPAPTLPPEQPKQNISVPIAIVVAGAMIALAVFLSGSKTGNPSSQIPDEEVTGEIKPVSSSDHILGDANAPVVVVEYSDLECPYCKLFHATMQRIVKDYNGKVAWVYRHYPIDGLHPKAAKEAEATECAAEQGGNAMFWKYTDRIFEVTPSNNQLDLAELPKIASDLGLDTAKFEECLSSNRYAAKIDSAVEDAVAAGARGTPYSVIISGKIQIPVNGAEPYEMVKAKIDSLLD